MISVCVIAKNEEKNIEKCLSSFADKNCEIVLVDTGSSDNTVKLAKNYTDKIYFYEWENDFSKAKNYCISKASNDIVLCIDCDEYWDDEKSKNIEEIESEFINSSQCIGTVTICNIFSKNGEASESWEKVGRLFNRQKYKYEGAVHEQLAAVDGSEPSYKDIQIYIKHTGYDLDEESARIKADRNRAILLAELDNNKDESYFPYIYYQLGKTEFVIHQYDKAYEWFSKALTYDLNPELEYVKDLVESYGYSLLELKEFNKALELEGIYNEFAGSSDLQFLMGLIYMNNGIFDMAVNEFKKAAEKKEAKVQGVNSYRAFYNIGVIYECTGNINEAIEYYELCGRYHKAIERLKELKS